MAYSKGQLQALWIAAGGAPADADTASAIALSESSGDPKAQGPIVKETGLRACGLWQIHPPQAGCQNPILNARMAVAKKRTQGWGAWVQYSNGSYTKYLSKAGGGGGAISVKFDPLHPSLTPNPLDPLGILPDPLDLVPGLGGSGIPNPLGAITDTVGVAKKFLEIARELMQRDTWFRIGKVILGWNLVVVGTVALLWIGVTLLSDKSANLTDPVKAGQQAASKASQIGDGVKAAASTAATAIAVAPK